MIIEIFAVLSAFISGYFVGKNKSKLINPIKNTKKHVLTINSLIRISNKTPPNSHPAKSKLINNQPIQIQQQKGSTKKKKNKKKKKVFNKQNVLSEIKEQQQRQQNYKSNNQSNSKDEKQPQTLWNSAKLDSTAKTQHTYDKTQISKSCEVFQSQSSRKGNLQSQQQLIVDFIWDQIELIRNYFLDELEEIMPYKQNTGKYRLTLIGTTKQMTVQWTYKDSLYPQQIIDIKFLYDSLKPIQIDQLNQIINDQTRIFKSQLSYSKYYNYIFNLTTAIYQDLLMQIHQEVQQSYYAQKGSKQVTHILLNKTHQQGHDTSRIMTMDKKQIYGELIQQIFYMQDFKSQPNDSLLHQNLPQNIHKKYHTRGRYINEFQELEMIGQGGFGKVYRAKNKVDSNTYAIKKIVINYQNSTDRKLLKQVALLSKLNHPNIVRYHQSWLQDVGNISQLIDDMSITESQEKQQLQNIYEDWRRSKKGIIFLDQSLKRKQQQSFEQNDEDGIMFEQDAGIQFEDCSEIQFQQASKSISQNPPRKFTFPKVQQQSSVDQQDQKSDFPFKILYIVMQFCQGINLKQFISKRFNEEQIKIQIIRGILQGLAYIHQRKIIHRDLKPANIFLTENNKVKIGDFGLATTGTFQEKAIHQIYDKSNKSNEFQKTVGIGTAFYRAPQQLKSPKYDEKVDIYSLGIIIFQMFYGFQTYSQRFKILSDITKTFKLPKDFNLYGQITDYQISIQNCIKQKPQLRPTARKLLQNFRNKYFVLLVSAIANPKYVQFYQLIKHLFQISNERRVQSVRRNYFRYYNFEEIFNIYRIHRGNMFPSFPFIYVNDYKNLNGFKIQSHQSRKQKFLIMSQQGALLQYATNLYGPWIVYAKQSMRRRKAQFLDNQLDKVDELRRFAFQKIIQAEFDPKKQQNIFKQKYVTGFDICYDLDGGFSPFLTLQMLIISSNITQTLHLTQQNPSLYLCHSKIYSIISKHYKIPIYKLYSCLLSTSQQKFSMMTETKQLQYFQKYQIQGLAAKKLSQLLEQSFEELDQWLKAFQIWNIEEYTEYWEIYDQFKKVLKLNQVFDLQSIEFKLMIPPNNCNGIFWNIGPVKGFTAVQDYNTATLNGYLCNLNIELSLSQGQESCDVSFWSNQQYHESQLMELVLNCWKMGVSAKFYERGMGQKDQTSKMNIIIKKKKGERVHYYIRKNQQRKNANKFKHQEINKQLSSVVVKQQFNYEVFKQLHPQIGSSNGFMGLGKKKSDQRS